MQLEFLVSFIIYLAVVMAIGLIAAYKQRVQSSSVEGHEFILGGRSTHWFLTALSAHAADMSDWLFMGLPAAVYIAGGSEVWICIGLLFGMFCSWHLIAAPLRRLSEKYNSCTLTSYFKAHFHDTSGILVAITALISCFFFAVYLSVGIKGIGYVLQSAFDIDYHIGTLIAVFVVALYTVIGGFVSVAWIDLFQGLFLLAMLLLVPLVGYHAVGGYAAISAAAQAKNISLALIPDYSWKTILGIMLNPFAWALGYFGMPHILTKFMGCADAEDMHKAKYVGVTWQLLALSAAVLVGMVGIAYFQSGVPIKTEFIYIEMAKGLFLATAPWLAGMVLCAILAATISTVDSQLLVLAGIIAQDFYKQFINKKADANSIRRIYKIALVLSALAGYAIAWNEHSSIMALVKYAWAGLGASFGPLLLISLYTKKRSFIGAVAAVITGAIVAATWAFINPYITDVQIYAIVPGYIASFIAFYLGSLVDKR